MRGRKPLSVGMKQNKEDFDKQLKEYSTTALKNIITIAENSFDANTRLKANQYLVDRCFGRDYRAVMPDETKQDKDIGTHITLTVVTPEHTIDIENINNTIKQIENTTDNPEDELWETDVYTP